MATVELKEKVEVRIFSGSAKKFFKKIFLLSTDSLKMMLKVGSKIPPLAKGLREGVVIRVTRKEKTPHVWVETDSYYADLEELLNPKEWEKDSDEQES